MLRLLLFILDESILIPIVWSVGGLLVVLLIAGIFVQRRTGVKLKRELAELDKVRQSNIEFEFVLKAMNLCTWHIDPKMQTITMDADFRDDKGNITSGPDTSLETLLGIMEKSDSQRVKIALNNICTGRSNFYHEQYRVMPGKSGLMYWEESFATIAARDEEGNPTKIVGTSMRIDAQKQMEAELINARNKAEESDRLKTAFLANMGHEIRTPLNAIVGFADLLPVVESEEDRNQLISEIQMNNHKLLQIIDGLVSMSKVEAEAKNLIKSQVDIVPVLQNISDSFTGMVDPLAVILATQFPYPELMMNTDTNKLTEIVKNLMDNAVKFTSHGNITLGFDLVDGDHVRIWVRDTGKGIAETDQYRIFERFVKIDEYIPGTGLGLSVAKAHVESLGGKMGVDSQLGSGSTFWIELPLA